MARFRQGELVVLDWLGDESLTVTTAAAPLASSLPATKDVRQILIQPQTQAIRVRSGAGGNPTSTRGLLVLANQTLSLEGDPSTLKFILDASAGSTSTAVEIHYLGG